MKNEDDEFEEELDQLSEQDEEALSSGEFGAETDQADDAGTIGEDDEIDPSADDIKGSKPSIHTSLTKERHVLIVDEAGDRRNETIDIIKQVLSNVQIATADNPEDAQREFEKVNYDTCVVNFLMPGYSSSDFVKSIANNPAHPLLVGFSADKMSDAYDPKKGIKIKPLRRIFEIDALKDADDENDVIEDET